MDAELPQDILASDDSSDDDDNYDQQAQNEAPAEAGPSSSRARSARFGNATERTEQVRFNGVQTMLQGHGHRGIVRLSEDEDSRSGNESTTSSTVSSSRSTTTSSTQSSSSGRREVVKNVEYFARRSIMRYLRKRGFSLLEKSDTTIGLDTAIENMKQALESTCSDALASCGVNYSGADVVNEVTRYWKFYSQLRAEAPACADQLKPMLMPMLVKFYQELLFQGQIKEAVSLYVEFSPKFYEDCCTKDNHDLLTLIGKISCASNLKQSEIKKHPVMQYLKLADFKFTLSSWVFERLQKFILESKNSVLPNLFSHQFDIHVVLDEAEAIESAECEVEAPEYSSYKSKSDATEMLCRFRGLLEPNLPSILVYKNVGRAVCGAISKHGSMVAYGLESSGISLFEAPPKQVGLKSYVKFPTEEIRSDCSKKMLNGHSGTVYGLCFHPRAKYIFSAGEDKLMRIWDAQTSKCHAVYRGHHCPIWSIDVTGSGTLIATGSMDTTARLWVPERTDYQRLLVGHYFDVDCVKFHPNEAYVATGSVDKSVRLWSVSDGNLVRVLLGSTGAVTCLDYHQNGRLLAAGGEDNLIRIWDLGEGKIVAELEGGTRCRSISFHNDMLAAAYANGSIQIWNLQNTLASCYSGEQREEEVTEYNSKQFPSGVTNVLRLYYKNPGLLYCVGSGVGDAAKEV